MQSLQILRLKVSSFLKAVLEPHATDYGLLKKKKESFLKPGNRLLILEAYRKLLVEIFLSKAYIYIYVYI